MARSAPCDTPLRTRYTERGYTSSSRGALQGRTDDRQPLTHIGGVVDRVVPLGTALFGLPKATRTKVKGAVTGRHVKGDGETWRLNGLALWVGS